MNETLSPCDALHNTIEHDLTHAAPVVHPLASASASAAAAVLALGRIFRRTGRTGR